MQSHVVTNVPCRSSNKVCSISCSVFITKGPYRAIGSPSGCPDTRSNRTELVPVVTVTESPSPKMTHLLGRCHRPYLQDAGCQVEGATMSNTHDRELTVATPQPAPVKRSRRALSPEPPWGNAVGRSPVTHKPPHSARRQLPGAPREHGGVSPGTAEHNPA